MNSNQEGVHPRLEAIVRRHLGAPWRQPLHEPTVSAFERVAALRGDSNRKRAVVLDSGCGTGESTERLALAHPEALVVGVDQSAARLSRVGAEDAPLIDGNVIWVRAELASFWRLAYQAAWPVTHHYLLYPNPWPKAAQLQRRWHGHPVFPALLALGGVIEVRSNWAIYLQEFAQALAVALALETGRNAVLVEAFTPASEPLTPFERKYAASGHDLWRLRFELPKTSI